MEFRNINVSVDLRDWVVSPLAGEMGGNPEGGAVPLRSQDGGLRSTLPPSALPGISPTWGEIKHVVVVAETSIDVSARDALLNRAMGPRWKKKSSEKLRRGRLPAEGLAFVAQDAAGGVIGTVRLWDVVAGGTRALLLGPLAVDPEVKSAGIGSALMRHAIAEARRLGHGAILLVGDAGYYARFGFSSAKTGTLSMPGPYERNRFLALELTEGALDGASGTLSAAGRKTMRERARAVA